MSIHCCESAVNRLGKVYANLKLRKSGQICVESGRNSRHRVTFGNSNGISLHILFWNQLALRSLRNSVIQSHQAFIESSALVWCRTPCVGWTVERPGDLSIARGAPTSRGPECRGLSAES